MSPSGDGGAEENGAVVSVMDVGGTHVAAANVDLRSGAIPAGQPVRLALDSHAGAEEFVATLVACAAALPTRPGRRWSIAVPGPFDYAHGIAWYEGVGKFDALRGFDLGEALATKLPDAAAIAFHNDADAFGVGEWWRGAAQGRRRVAGITLGTGIGSCFLQDGRPLREGPGIPPGGRINELHYAGKPLEETVSRQALRQAYAEAVGADPEAADVKEIAQRAREGEEAAVRVFERTYRILGTVLASILGGFAPDILVVGGSIAASWDLIAGPLTAGLHEAESGRAQGIAVVPAAHPAQAALLGAAHLAAEGNTGSD
ncbi:ROK family protein [Actinospica durhamensis]|uniref:ROK family protein n=1 Tax=Actinospica durhamensis TaxID=1508375 RepID=A0A941EWD5_9ACTN|nr:ROK family protein [Actinospica durhamensis]MBR7835159.1 ROK family protein [Actinospica durhamensis]